MYTDVHVHFRRACTAGMQGCWPRMFMYVCICVVRVFVRQIFVCSARFCAFTHKRSGHGRACSNADYVGLHVCLYIQRNGHTCI
jgi:hypothetical protein